MSQASGEWELSDRYTRPDGSFSYGSVTGIHDAERAREYLGGFGCGVPMAPNEVRTLHYVTDGRTVVLSIRYGDNVRPTFDGRPVREVRPCQTCRLPVVHIAPVWVHRESRVTHPPDLGDHIDPAPFLPGACVLGGAVR